ncbi:hypothetical protein GQ457_07G008640 [Hibiscus cannabinus]
MNADSKSNCETRLCSRGQEEAAGCGGASHGRRWRLVRSFAGWRVWGERVFGRGRVAAAQPKTNNGSRVHVERIEINGPWFFNYHMLLLHHLVAMEDPMSVPLHFLDLWVLLHDLPIGFRVEGVAKQLGVFIGKFLEYDSKSISLNYKQIKRVRARIDTRLPLKRRTKIVLQDGSSVYACFQCKKIQISVLCGSLSYGEIFCPTQLTMEPQNIIFNWDISLSAPSRRVVLASLSVKNGSIDSGCDPSFDNTYNRGYNQGAQMGIPLMGSRNNLLDSSSLLIEGQTFQVFNNLIQCLGLNNGIPARGLPNIDVHMGFGSDDNPIEPSDVDLAELYPTDDDMFDTMEAKLELNLEIDKGKIYWEQRAWENLLRNGDRNIVFFS